MPPAILVGGAILGGVLAAKKASAASKASKSNSGATGNFAETPNYDPNRFEYGGDPNTALDQTTRFGGQQVFAAQRGKEFLNTAEDDRNLSLQARGQQQQAQNLMLKRAQGQDLIADKMATRARRDLTSRMGSAVASARGPAGLANAQGDAMAAEAQGLGAINEQASIAGMQEQQQAEQAAFAGASGMREGDAASRAQSISGAGVMGNIGTAYGGLENQVHANKNSLNVAQQQLLEGSKQNADKLNTQAYQAGKQRDTEGIKAGLGLVSGLASAAAAASDPLAKTGTKPIGGDLSVDTEEKPQPRLDLHQHGATKSNLTIGMKPAGEDLAGDLRVSDPKAKKEAYLLGLHNGQQAGLAGDASPFDPKSIRMPEDFGKEGGPKLASLGPENRIPIPEGASDETRFAISKENMRNGGATPRRAVSFSRGGVSGGRSSETTAARGLSIQTEPGGTPPRAGRFDTSESMFVRPGTDGLPTPERESVRYPEGLGEPLATMSKPASDPRAKELGGVHSNEVAETLDATPAVSYKYKDPGYEPEAERPGERQAGFLTTDLKKTPLGAAVVEQRPDGLEGYNEHRLNGLQHAEIRNLHERLRELEAAAAGGGRRAR